MPIRPFKDIPRNAVEWAKFFNQTEVTPSADSVGGNQIQDGQVTYAKLQNVTPDRLLGRDTSPAGTVQELTVDGGLEFTGSGIRRSALTGAIEAAAGSTATTFRNSAAVSVIGRSANSAGTPADIAASANGHYLRRSGDVVGFGAIADADIPNTIARQSTGTYTATLTGCATSPTVTVRYVLTGNTVTLFVPSVNATSNATTCTLTGAPAAIRPTRDQGLIAVLAQDNTTLLIGLARMLTTGVIELRPGSPFGSTSWTNSGTKGIDDSNLTYNID